jgi:anthranilate/para-aminobenzoate synthase component II
VEVNSFYKAISKQVLKSGLVYITGMEAYKYPIYSVLYHPEYQMMMNPNEDTLAIANSFSRLLFNKGV